MEHQQLEGFFEKRQNDIRKILNQMNQTTERGAEGRPELVRELRHQLVPLMRMKERVVYPKMKSFDDDEINRLITRHSEQHRIFEIWIDELEQTEPKDPLWRARFEILRDGLEPYFHFEELRTLRLADRLLTDSQKRSLKQELQKEERDLALTT